MTVVTIVLSIACFIVGGFASYLFFKHGLKNKYDGILRDAEAEAEVIKKNKLLEVKEKFLNKKADLEKEVAQRNQKIQQAENKLKQRELVLNQRQEEIQRKKMEAEAVKENLEAQLSIVDKKKEELEHMQRQEIEKLEAISGLSAEEAKERMVESLKEEAKTQAQSYINDIMDDAKLTASKEAKRIVIQSIQRVATETAIENSVTVFHIESDEIKGRIIGREGRNIRALEAATGVEIVVDDTPEAIVLSAFDPVRREIAAPKGGATKRQLHSMECYCSSKPSDNCRFSASSFFWAAKVFFRTYVLANVTRSPLNTIRGLINQRLSAGPRAMISAFTSSASPL